MGGGGIPYGRVDENLGAGRKERKRNPHSYCTSYKRSPSLVKPSKPRLLEREEEREALSGLKSET